MYDPLEESAPTSYVAQLEPVNGTEVRGRATVKVTDEGMVVTVEARGFGDGLAHLQHLHARGEGSCPTPAAAGDDLVSAADVEEVAGAPIVSLTTEGDVDAASQLHLERYPVPVDGAIGYSRTFDIPAPLQLSDLTDAVLVQHGLPTQEGAADDYDGPTTSSADVAIDSETMLPVSCGALEPAGTSEGAEP